MSNGKWLLLIFFIALIVLTFVVMKEYQRITPPVSEVNPEGFKEFSSLCQDFILNDTTEWEGKTFKPPKRDSSDMAKYLNFLTSVGIKIDDVSNYRPMAKMGNYWDGADRRIQRQINPVVAVRERTNSAMYFSNRPNIRISFVEKKLTPEQCALRAKYLGYNVAGSQYDGQCWASNDLDRAKSYGASPYDGNYQEGRAWNNFVMADVTDRSCVVNEYSKYITELLKNNITSYKQLATFNQIEPFVEGLVLDPYDDNDDDVETASIVQANINKAAKAASDEQKIKSNYVLFSNVDLPGYDFDNRSDTVANCADTCDNNNNCKGFVHDRRDGKTHCWFKNSDIQPEYVNRIPDIDFYLKKDEKDGIETFKPFNDKTIEGNTNKNKNFNSKKFEQKVARKLERSDQSSPFVGSELGTAYKSLGPNTLESGVNEVDYNLQKIHVPIVENEVRKSGLSYEDFLKKLKKYILDETNKLPLNSSDIMLLRSKLRSIGYSNTDRRLVGGAHRLSDLGVSYDQLKMSNFEEPYLRLSKNIDNKGNAQPGNFDKIYNFAVYMNVSDRKDSKFPISTLSSLLVEQKLSVDDLSNLQNILMDFYTPRNDAKLFVSLIRDATYYSEESKGSFIERLQYMKDDLKKHNVPSYDEYVNIQTIINNNSTVSARLNEFIYIFYKYYTQTDPKWFSQSSSGQQLQLRQALQLFVKYLKANAKTYNKVNLYHLVKAGNRENIPVEQLTITSLGKRTIENFTQSTIFEGYTPEPGEKGTLSMAIGLQNMGVRDINEIQVSTNSPIMNETQFIQYIQSKIPGINDEVSRIEMIHWFGMLGMIQTDIDSFFVLLQKLKITSYDDLMKLKSKMERLKIRSLVDITEFMTIITNFGVSGNHLDDFLQLMERFGVSLATERDNAYQFLDLLKRYDITYEKSPYDHCLTKFTIFILNLTSDYIHFHMYSFTIVPLLRMLNNGVEPTTIPANPTEKQKLNRNMRDLIIRREKSIYTGGDFNDKTYGYTRCNNQFPGKIPVEDWSQNDSKIYQETVKNGKPGTAPPFLFELNTEGKEEPTAYLTNTNSLEIIPTNYPVSAQVIKTRLFYATILLVGENQSEESLQPLHRDTPVIDYKYIVSNLTPYEYSQFQTGKPNLIVSSVMSRLYAKIVSDANTHKAKSEFIEYNAKLDLINYIRILPYYTFRLIAREIGANPNKYDVQNDNDYRDLKVGVKPFFPETPGAVPEDYEVVDGTSSWNFNFKGFMGSKRNAKKASGPVEIDPLYRQLV